MSPEEIAIEFILDVNDLPPPTTLDTIFYEPVVVSSTNTYFIHGGFYGESDKLVVCEVYFEDKVFVSIELLNENIITLLIIITQSKPEILIFIQLFL